MGPIFSGRRRAPRGEIHTAMSTSGPSQTRMEALQTCLATAAWLNTEIERGLTSLWRVWPVAARWWQRGIHFGRRVYERGHHDRLTQEAAADILSEVASLPAPVTPPADLARG
jgi:hypothetical protein